MAETKYDLQLVNTKTDTKIYNQPWYKERLHTKYIKSLGPTDTSAFLHGRNWTFIKDGLDDFRDGLPPPVDEENVILKGNKGIQPNIQGSSSDLGAVKQPAVRNRFNKLEVCYSRATPLQQQRREHIDEIEYGLTQHPLALYQHFEECMPADVFEDVVDILDPEMNLVDEEGEDELPESETDTISSHRGGGGSKPPPSEPGDKEEKEQSEPGTEEGKTRNLYRWLPRKEEKEKNARKKLAEKREASPSQDEHIAGVTRDFCKWVADLGGETNNIEESTITSLFASGYETKPALSVPIHVVELTNVPPELRMSAQVPKTEDKKEDKTAAQKGPAYWTHSGQYKPSWVKFRYGAWYLQPKTWTRMDADQPLEDPKALKDKETSEARKKSDDLDKKLAPMHGAKAFMDFIEHKADTVRRPEFLNRVGAIQEQEARLEAERLEAEAAKQRKLTSRRAAKDS